MDPKLPTPNISSSPRPVDTGKAIESRQRALALSETAGDKVGQAVNHADLARLLVQQGNPEKALMHLREAEPLTKAINDPKLQVDIFRIKGTAYLMSGDFEQAIDAYRQAMVVFRAVGDTAGQAEIYISVGWAYQSQAEVPKALSCYEDALKLFINAADHDGEVRTRMAIGSLYAAIGETNKALAQYKTALAIASPDQHAWMLANVAEMLLARNEPGRACDHYKIALSLIEPSSDLGLQGVVLAGMGRCRMAMGLYGYAQDYLEEAGSKMRQARNTAGEAGVNASLGELFYWAAINSPEVDPKPRFTAALNYYKEALPVMRATGNRIGEIGVLANAGLVYDAWDKPRQALPYYLQALQEMDELQTSARLEEFRIDVAEQSASLYQRAILLEFSQHHMEEAFNLSERARARWFLDQLGNSRIDLGKHLSLDFAEREKKLRGENILLQRQLGQELAQPGPEIVQERVSSLQTQLSLVRKQYEGLLSELKLSNPEYASFLSISPLTLSRAQQQLGPDVTLVSYYTTPKTTVAFVLTKDSLHVTTIPVTEAALTHVIASLLDFPAENEAPPALKILYKWLIAPIKSKLKTSTLAVVPYGVLNEVPFSALTPDGEHYLSDSYATFSLPSVSVLPYIRATMKPLGDQILVLANDKSEGLPGLSHAYDEAQAVASVYETQPKLGNNATVSVLKAQAGHSNILHLIGHIERNNQDPQFSRINMGQGNESDGPLELNQVFGLDLEKTDLVVLSGCQSQTGKRSRGDDVTSLSRAFMYAGSRSVIASLWDVDDEATQQLMVAFYTHLREGLSKAEALRTAQVDIRQQYPNPYYWAGFVLTGDPGKVGTFDVLANSVK